jgi:hypothetical protein
MSVVLVAVAVVAPGLAHAQYEPGPRAWIGGSLGLSPIGTLKSTASGGPTFTDDAAVAFQINGLLDYRVTPLLSIGFAPGIIFNVKTSGGDSSGTELDLPIRLALGGPVAPKVRLYGFVSPGYSVLFPPSDSGGGHPSGLMLGFGGGVGVRVARGVMLTGELGYQFRFLSTTETIDLGNFELTTDVSLQENYLTFAVGIVAALP